MSGLRSVSIACAALSVLTTFTYAMALNSILFIKYMEAKTEYQESPWFADKGAKIEFRKEEKTMIAVHVFIIICSILEIILAIASVRTEKAMAKEPQDTQVCAVTLYASNKLDMTMIKELMIRKHYIKNFSNVTYSWCKQCHLWKDHSSTHVISLFFKREIFKFRIALLWEDFRNHSFFFQLRGLWGPEGFVYFTIKFTTLPPLKKLLSIFMIPPSLIRDQLSTAFPPPLLYSVSDDWSTLHSPWKPCDPLKDLGPPPAMNNEVVCHLRGLGGSEGFVCFTITVNSFSSKALDDFYDFRLPSPYWRSIFYSPPPPLYTLLAMTLPLRFPSNPCNLSEKPPTPTPSPHPNVINIDKYLT